MNKIKIKGRCSVSRVILKHVKKNKSKDKKYGGKHNYLLIFCSFEIDLFDFYLLMKVRSTKYYQIFVFVSVWC